MPLNASMCFDKKKSLFTLMTAWKVFLRVRDAPTGELRSRLSHVPSTHFNMLQDFPAFFLFTCAASTNTDALWEVNSCDRLLKCAKAGTACEAPHVRQQICRDIKTNKWKVRCRVCTISTWQHFYLFIYLADTFFWSEVEYDPSFRLLKQLIQSAGELSFQHSFRHKCEMVIEGEERHK